MVHHCIPIACPPQLDDRMVTTFCRIFFDPRCYQGQKVVLLSTVPASQNLLAHLKVWAFLTYILVGGIVRYWAPLQVMSNAPPVVEVESDGWSGAWKNCQR